MAMWSRRKVGRLMLGAPVAAALAAVAGRGQALAQQQAVPTSSGNETPPLAKLLSKEDGLSGEERDKVRKSVTQLEKSLKAIRDFQLSNDIPPAGTFRALRSRRS
jgi:hypothetical protein